MSIVETREIGESLQLLGDETVYRRTPPGQREVLFMQRGLSPLEQRLLLVVNGNTSLRTLIDLIDSRGDVGGAIRHLVELGMIEVVRTP